MDEDEVTITCEIAYNDESLLCQFVILHVPSGDTQTFELPVTGGNANGITTTRVIDDLSDGAYQASVAVLSDTAGKEMAENRTITLQFTIDEKG